MQILRHFVDELKKILLTDNLMFDLTEEDERRVTQQLTVSDDRATASPFATSQKAAAGQIEAKRVKVLEKQPYYKETEAMPSAQQPILKQRVSTQANEKLRRTPTISDRQVNVAKTAVINFQDEEEDESI